MGQSASTKHSMPRTATFRRSPRESAAVTSSTCRPMPSEEVGLVSAADDQPLDPRPEQTAAHLPFWLLSGRVSSSELAAAARQSAAVIRKISEYSLCSATLTLR